MGRGSRGGKRGATGSDQKQTIVLSDRAKDYQSVLFQKERYFGQDNLYLLSKKEGGFENIDLPTLESAYMARVNEERQGYNYRNNTQPSDEALKDAFGDAGAYYIRSSGNIQMKYDHEDKMGNVFYKVTEGQHKGKTIRERKSDLVYSPDNSKTYKNMVESVDRVGTEKMYKYGKSNKVKVTRKDSPDKLRTKIKQAGLEADARSKGMFYSYDDEMKIKKGTNYR